MIEYVNILFNAFYQIHAKSKFDFLFYKTAEVLIRLLRLNILEQVLRLIAHNEIKVNNRKGRNFDMDYTPGLYWQEQDKYCIWMILLYYQHIILEYVCVVLG